VPAWDWSLPEDRMPVGLLGLDAFMAHELFVVHQYCWFTCFP